MPKDIDIEIVLSGDRTVKAKLKDIDKVVKDLGGGFSKTQARLVTFASTMQLAKDAARFLRDGMLIAKDAIAGAIEQASDFQEASSKFGVVFASVKDQADSMRENLVKNFGFSRKAATELTASTGDILTGFGLTEQAALQLTDKTAQLAADLASFTNAQGGAAAVSEALTKAYVGERESLKQYGIVILESDVKTRLAAKGQDQLTGASLRTARAQVTLEIALEQSKNALGDFARTSDQLANQQRILNNRFEDLQILLGEKLVPISSVFVREANNIVGKTIDWVNANDKLIQQNIFEFVESGIKVVSFLGQGFVGLLLVLTRIEGGIKLIAAGVVSFGEIVLSVLGSVIKGWLLLGDAVAKGVGAGVTKAKLLFNEFLQDILQSVSDSDVLQFLLPEESLKNIKSNLISVKNEIKQLRVEDSKPLNIGQLEGTSKKIVDTIGELIVATGEVRQNFLGSALETENTFQNLVKVSQKLFEIQDAVEGGIKNLRLDLKVDGSQEAFDEVNKRRIESEKETLESIASQRAEAAERQAEAEQLAFDQKLEREIGFTEALTEAFQIRKSQADTYFNTISNGGVQAFQRLEDATTDALFSLAKNQGNSKKIFEDFFKNTLLKLGISTLVRLASQFVIFGLIQKETTRVAALSSISAQAGRAFAGQFANVIATVPFPANLAIAPAAAAAASAQTISGASPFLLAQQGLEFVDRAAQPAILHFGETVLTRNQTSALVDFLEKVNRGETSSNQGPIVNVSIDNATLLSEDEEAIGRFSLLLKRAIEEQNIFGVGAA